MLVAAAVCPCPPLLVPEVAAGAAAELDEVRTACAQALGVLAAAQPERLVVVGPRSGDGHETLPDGTPGTFAGYGVALEVRLGAAVGPAGGAALPASLAVAAWLLDRSVIRSSDGPSVPVTGVAVGERLAPQDCAALGRDLTGGPARTALLTMGDGSARRSPKAPGAYDDRAPAFDSAAARALAAADTAALAALDPELAHGLRAAGRAPWQVLAGAADGAGLRGRLLHDAAPYGVGYLVAVWS